MATVTQAQDKAGNYIKYNTKSKMNFILDYINDPQKTKPHLQGGTFLTNFKHAYDEFMLTKQIWGKAEEGKRMCMHYIQSFQPGEVTPEQAKELADEFVNQKIFQGFQISYATHVDKAHIHTHFVINTVNIEDGHKWQLADLKILRRLSDGLCKKHGFSVLPEEISKKRKSPAQIAAEERGKGWKKETQMAVDEVLKIAANRADFIKLMQIQGYQVQWKEERKYILFVTPEGKRIRNRLFEGPENYTKEALQKRLKENQKHRNREENGSNQNVQGFGVRKQTYFDVRDAARVAVSKEDFISLLNAQGYEVQWDDRHKYITFSMDGHSSVRNRSFYPKEEYTKEALEEKFDQNKEELEKMKDGTYREETNEMDENQMQRSDLVFLLNSIFSSHGTHPYPYQRRSTDRSIRELEEWRKEMEKGRGMDWEH